jgi:Cu(I)/Ag(I) efflux system protein CusF
MRAIACALVGALTLAATGAAAADDMANMKGMSTSAAPAAKQGKGTGVIKAIDAKAGTLTIQHGPIPAVSWPAMTMTFKAKPATLLKGLKVGETIGFDTTVRGMDADVTAVRPK